MVNDTNEFGITYRYKWHYVPFVWLSLFLPFIVLLSVWIIFGQGWLDGLIVLGLGLTFAMLMAWFSLQQVADICVSNEEITRRVLRWTWQHMRWTDVARLTIMRSTNLETGRRVRAFALKGSKNAPLFSRRIIFQERPGEMNQLLDRLEACIAKHHINVREL